MFKNRPVAVVLLAFTAGIASGLFFNLWLPVLTLVLGWSVMMLIRPSKRTRVITVFSLGAITVGALYGVVYAALSALPAPESGKVYCYYAYVKDVRPVQSGMRITAEIDDSDSEFDGYTVYIYNDLDTANGDVLWVEGVMTEASVMSRGENVDYYVYGRASVCNEKRASMLLTLPAKVRQSISSSISNSFSEESSGFYSAMITGDRRNMDTELNALFSRAGISHILAISGQHYSIIIFSIYGVLRKIFKKRSLCSGICIVLSVLYTLLVGASPSVIRACIMCCAAFGANLFFTRYDSFVGLTAALALIVTVSPYSIASVGLQLSFLATAGIIATITMLERRRRKKRRLTKLLSACVMPLILSVAATLACMPVFLQTFDYISVISPLTNMVVNALVTPALILSIPIAAITAIFPGLAQITFIPDMFFYAIREAARFAANMPFSTLSAYIPNIDLAMIPSISALVLCTSLKKKAAIRSAVICLLASIIIVTGCVSYYIASLNDNALIAIHTDSDNSYILSSNSGKTILIDIYGEADCSENVLMQGFTELDCYISLNCDEDALYRLEHLLYYINIDTLYLPEEEKSGEFAEKFGDKVKTTVFYARDTVIIGDTELCVSAKANGYGEYIINTACNGTALTIMGGCTSVMSWCQEHADGLVVSPDCLVTECRYDVLPQSYETLYMPPYEESVFTAHLENGADNVSNYDGTLVLRYGKDGIEEVKQ